MKFIVDGTAQRVMQPARYQIVQLLRSSTTPLFVEQIAKETGIHPRMVSHHLDVLEEDGVVKCRYEISRAEGSRRGMAVRLCEATPKAMDVLRDIEESIRGTGV